MVWREARVEDKHDATRTERATRGSVVNLQKALDARELSKRYVSFDPTSVDGIIEAAARRLLEGTEIWWCLEHEASVLEGDPACAKRRWGYACRFVKATVVVEPVDP